jgi:hypothetical protein
MREYLEHDYIPIKATSDNFKQSMEYALGIGATVICQNVG